MTTPFDCPRCGSVLTMSERHGIEIDYCPQCRGVWLDRGELDKIIDRAGIGEASQPVQPQPVQPQPAPQAGWRQPPPQPPLHPWAPSRDGGQTYRHDDDRDRRRYSDDDARGYRGKSRKNWLSELFD